MGYSDPAFRAPTAFQRSAELTRPRDACAEAAGFPQIGMLLLTKGGVPHERMWREWFRHAAGKIPLSAARTAFCDGYSEGDGVMIDVNRTAVASPSDVFSACFQQKRKKRRRKNDRDDDGDDDDDDDVIAQQHLFDVWVHPAVDFPGFAEGSVFRGRELPPEFRVETVWGTHTIVDATRALLAAGLTNPLSQKFILFSESDVPLYSPMTLYTQLMSEHRSRVNACLNETIGRWDHNEGSRLRGDMLAEGLTAAIWRKSWQWVALTRKHAEFAVEDEEIDAAFRATCRRRWDPDWCDHRVCYSDEHYFPTLLAAKGVENDTDCYGEMTDRDWSRGLSTDPHPWEYSAREVDQILLERLRHSERKECTHAHSVGTAAEQLFVDFNEILEVDGGGVKEEKEAQLGAATAAAVCHSLSPVNDKSYTPLGPFCPLLARKFLNNTVNAVLASLLPCKDGLGIVNSAGECSGERALEQAALLAELDLDFPPEAVREGETSSWVWKVYAGVAVVGVVLFIVGWTMMLGWHRQRRLPLSHSESFHTTLRNYGVIE